MSETEIGRSFLTYLLGAPSVVPGGTGFDSCLFALVQSLQRASPQCLYPEPCLSILEEYLLLLLNKQQEGHEFHMGAELHVAVLLGQNCRCNRKHRQCFGD